jgi:hypothetical protein
MGMRTTIPNSNSFLLRDQAHRNAKAAIHRAIVTDVHVEKGTVSVRLEDIPHVAEVGFPLMGFSIPPSSSTTESESVDFSLSSWGRYIPQVRDIIYVAFGMNGNLHALGYSSVFYGSVERKSYEEEDSGGLGWGEASGTKVESGDWDFKSSRGSVLYLGDKAKIGSTNCVTTFNCFTGDIVTESPLTITNAGASESRFGAARRKVLPTNAQEEYMPSTRGGTTCQEWSTVVRWESLPSGLDLAGFSFGDVIEDLGGSYAIKVSPKFLTTRRYFYSVSEAGTGTTYEELVDSNGNYYVDSVTSVESKWTMPLSAWSITNLSTEITSSKSFSATVTTTTDFTSGGQFSVTAPSVILGSAAAQPLVLGPAFTAGFNSFLTTFTALFTALASASAVPPLTPLGASFTSLATACGTLQSALSGMVTAITKAS